MKLLTLSCNECGAPLEVPESAKFVTCGFCSSRLAVQHTSNAVYTEALEKIGKQTEQLAQDVETIKLQNQLERLDREWTQECEQYMVHDKSGKHLPNATGSAIGAVVMVVFGIFWMGLAVSIGAPCFFPLFGIFFIVAAICIGISGMNKAGGYEQAHKRYQRRRHELLGRIQSRDSATEGNNPFGQG